MNICLTPVHRLGRNSRAFISILLLLIWCGWVSPLGAHAQTNPIPKNYHQILGNAGIDRSQLLNGAIAERGSFLGSVSQAERWYEAAAAQGNTHALHNLAVILYCGDRRSLDIERAFKLLEESSEIGSVSAPWLIGIAYFLGDVAPKNYARSIPWLELSARRDNRLAVHLLIKIYDEGLGTPPSEEKALWWLNFAAGHGDTKAQIRLAEHLAKASPEKRNLIASYYWLISARKEGAVVDMKLIDSLEKEIDPATAETLRLGNTATQGRFRWHSWSEESLIQGTMFPCMRHLDNQSQAKLDFTE